MVASRLKLVCGLDQFLVYKLPILHQGERPLQEWRRACGQPPTTWIRQVCHNMGVTVTEALQLVEDRPFWWTIAMARGL